MPNRRGANHFGTTVEASIVWYWRSRRTRRRLLDARKKNRRAPGDRSRADKVYRQIQGIYPDQVRVVFIHRVNDNVPAARVAGMVLIENYAEAAAHLYGVGVLTEAQARRVMTAARREGLAIEPAVIDALIEAHRPQ